MLSLSNLSPNLGSNRQRKRVGRGPGSGRGKTATRGHKGANSRSGASVRPGFEGGQMPLQRRLPKRGFHSKFKTIYSIVSLTQLNNIDVTGDITSEVLFNAGLIKKVLPVKVLANGDISKAIVLHIDKISQEAKAKIELVGGKVIEANSF